MPLERHVNAFEDEMEILVGLDVGAMWERFLGEALNQYAQLQREGKTTSEIAEEMDAFLKSLSDKPMERLSRTGAGVAYNQGRIAEILSAEAEAEVEFVVRSEVLDKNTCPPCSRLDGTVVAVDSPEFHELAPPARCEGGAQCRGFYVAIGA